MNGHLIKNNKKIVLLSLVLACFNPNVLFAQVTPAPDTAVGTDTTTDTTTDTSETSTETPAETENTATVILIPDTGGTQDTPSTNSNGGGGSGAGILVLAAAGFLVANMSPKNKKPAIQKTFIETGLGKGTVLTEYRSKSFLENQKSKGALSLQLSSDANQYGSKSIVNLRWSRKFSDNLTLYSDLGSSWESKNNKNELLTSDWLSVNLRQDGLFSKQDFWVLTGQLAKTPSNTAKNSLFENQTIAINASEYGSLFSDPSTRIELAYVRRLVDNQQLGFRLAVEKLNNDAQDSNATLLWQKRF